MDDLLKLIAIAKESGLKSVSYQGISLEFGASKAPSKTPENFQPIQSLPKEEPPSEEEFLFMATEFVPESVAE